MRVDFGGGEDDATIIPVHRPDQGVVLACQGGLGELHVVGDPLGAIVAQTVDQLRVEMARKRPLKAELIEGRGVDLHDRQVLGRGLGAADREAGIDRAQLLTIEQMILVGEERDRRAEEREEDQGAAAAAVQPLQPHQGLAR